MVGRCGQHQGIDGVLRFWVMKDIESLGPRFAIAWRADDAAEGAWLSRVWIGVIFEACAQDHQAFRPKSSENAEPIEFRDRSAVAEEDGADVLGAWQVEEVRRNL